MDASAVPPEVHLEAQVSIHFVCRRCKEPILGEVHRVRIILVNAGSTARPDDVDKMDEFHHACAAAIFHAFDGEKP